MSDIPLSHIKSFVRRAGRMTDLQKKSYQGLSDRYCVDATQGLLDFTSIYGRQAPLVIEIGFGMGISTAIIAQGEPLTNFLGIEVHRPGIGKLMSEMESKKIDNLKIIEGDAVDVLSRSIPEASIRGIHLFFPDPWPKKKHHKRRILSPAFVALAASRIAAGGYFYMVTDWEEYAHEALVTLSASTALRNSATGFAERREWRPVTKFEMKAIKAGRLIRELYFLKTPASP
jgi:tRNA (guanine-N7-)-methyltransferase